MKQLYYMRHGESVANKEGVWAAHGDTPLTDKGKEQAELAGKLAKKSNLKIDVMFVSPLVRTQQTADIVAPFLDNPPRETITELIERGVGELEGTSHPGFFEQHEYKDIDAIEGAETVRELQERAQKVLEMVRQRPEESILIVSHSAFGRAFKRAISNISWEDEYKQSSVIPLPYAEIIQLI